MSSVERIYKEKRCTRANFITDYAALDHISVKVSP
jgi:hypothetical protein